LSSVKYWENYPSHLDYSAEGLDAGTYEILYKGDFQPGDVKDFTILIDSPI